MSCCTTDITQSRTEMCEDGLLTVQCIDLSTECEYNLSKSANTQPTVNVSNIREI